MGNKIIQIGPNRCGTRSLTRFFERNGISTVHWDGGLLAKRIAKRIILGQDPFLDYPTKIFFSDMELSATTAEPLLEMYKAFKYFYYWHPNAYYILNERAIDAWVASRAKHLGGQYIQNYKHFYGVDDISDVLELWKEDYVKHKRDVIDFFSERKAKFLIYNIEKDDTKKLKDFLFDEYQLTEEPLPRLNDGNWIEKS